MSEIIKVVSFINAGDAGTLAVNWKLKFWYDVPSETHQDNPIQTQQEYREVEEISYVALTAFDKIDIPITDSFLLNKKLNELLQEKLIFDISDKSIQEIKDDN